MSWTNPKTWSFGEILTSTDMNTYVRDNTSELFARSEGVGPNIVQTTLTSAFTASITTGVQEVTGLTVTITPTSASSKILVLVSLSLGDDFNNTSQNATLYRGTTAIFQADTAGSRRRATMGRDSSVGAIPTSIAGTYLDSPATTSATTYSVRVGKQTTSNGLIHVNRGFTDSDSVGFARTVSTITAIEVAA